MLLPSFPRPEYGYHSQKIKRGAFGSIEKVFEELEELEDAFKQEAWLMALCELSDYLGAVYAFIEKQNRVLVWEDAYRQAQSVKMADFLLIESLKDLSTDLKAGPQEMNVLAILLIAKGFARQFNLDLDDVLKLTVLTNNAFEKGRRT